MEAQIKITESCQKFIFILKKTPSHWIFSKSNKEDKTDWLMSHLPVILDTTGKCVKTEAKPGGEAETLGDLHPG